MRKVPRLRAYNRRMGVLSWLFSPRRPLAPLAADWDGARKRLAAVAAAGPRPPLHPKVLVDPDGETMTVCGVPAPVDAEAPTVEELRRTLDVLRQVYPSALHPAIEEIGPALALAALTLEHAALDRGLSRLLALPSDNPVVCYELARVALAVGDLEAAETALRAFARHAGGHMAIGEGTHTGKLLADVLAVRDVDRL